MASNTMATCLLTSSHTRVVHGTQDLRNQCGNWYAVPASRRQSVLSTEMSRENGDNKWQWHHNDQAFCVGGSVGGKDF
ncbi:hypothetical protein ACFX1R_037419 [Malus domestica]